MGGTTSKTIFEEISLSFFGEERPILNWLMLPITTREACQYKFLESELLSHTATLQSSMGWLDCTINNQTMQLSLINMVWHQNAVEILKEKFRFRGVFSELSFTRHTDSIFLINGFSKASLFQIIPAAAISDNNEDIIFVTTKLIKDKAKQANEMEAKALTSAPSKTPENSRFQKVIEKESSRVTVKCKIDGNDESLRTEGLTVTLTASATWVKFSQEVIQDFKSCFHGIVQISENSFSVDDTKLTLKIQSSKSFTCRMEGEELFRLQLTARFFVNVPPNTVIKPINAALKGSLFITVSNFSDISIRKPFLLTITLFGDTWNDLTENMKTILLTNITSNGPIWNEIQNSIDPNNITLSSNHQIKILLPVKDTLLSISECISVSIEGSIFLKHHKAKNLKLQATTMFYDHAIRMSITSAKLYYWEIRRWRAEINTGTDVLKDISFWKDIALHLNPNIAKHLLVIASYYRATVTNRTEQLSKSLFYTDVAMAIDETLTEAKISRLFALICAKHLTNFDTNPQIRSLFDDVSKHYNSLDVNWSLLYCGIQNIYFGTSDELNYNINALRTKLEKEDMPFKEFLLYRLQLIEKPKQADDIAKHMLTYPTVLTLTQKHNLQIPPTLVNESLLTEVWKSFEKNFLSAIDIAISHNQLLLYFSCLEYAKNTEIFDIEKLEVLYLACTNPHNKFDNAIRGQLKELSRLPKQLNLPEEQINNQAILLMWSAFETLQRDLLLRLLVNNPYLVKNYQETSKLEQRKNKEQEDDKEEKSKAKVLERLFGHHMLHNFGKIPIKFAEDVLNEIMGDASSLTTIEKVWGKLLPDKLKLKTFHDKLFKLNKMRHVIAHHCGRVGSDDADSRSGVPDFKKGDQIKATLEEVTMYAKIVEQAAHHLVEVSVNNLVK